MWPDDTEYAIEVPNENLLDDEVTFTASVHVDPDEMAAQRTRKKGKENKRKSMKAIATVTGKKSMKVKKSAKGKGKGNTGEAHTGTRLEAS